MSDGMKEGARKKEQKNESETSKISTAKKNKHKEPNAGATTRNTEIMSKQRM